MKNDLIDPKQKKKRVAVELFAVVFLLFANCVTAEFKIHSIELERRERNYLRFRLISDIDFLDERACQGHRCLIRFEFYPVEKGNPKRTVLFGNGSLKKEFPVDESGVKRQFDFARSYSGPTFSVYKSDYSEGGIAEVEMITFIGTKSDKKFEYLFKIPFEMGDAGESWNDPSLDDERVAEYYHLKEGTTYTFWGKVVGPTYLFTISYTHRIFPYFFNGIESQLYRWEVTIPK